LPPRLRPFPPRLILPWRYPPWLADPLDPKEAVLPPRERLPEPTAGVSIPLATPWARDAASRAPASPTDPAVLELCPFAPIDRPFVPSEADPEFPEVPILKCPALILDDPAPEPVDPEIPTDPMLK